MKRFWILTIVMLALCSVGVAAQTTAFFFHGLGCPHCAEMRDFLEGMESKYPDFEVKAFEVYYNSENQVLLAEMREKFNVEMQGVPTFFINDSVVVGYDATIGMSVEQLIRSCTESGCPSPEVVLSEDGKAIAAKGTDLREEGEGPGLGVFVFVLFVLLVIFATLMIIFIARQQKK